MIHVLTLFPNSLDKAKAEAIFSQAVPAFKSAEGLVSLTVSEGQIMAPGGPPPFNTVGEAQFESLEKFMAWVETQEAHQPKDIFKDTGIVRMFYEVKTV